MTQTATVRRVLPNGRAELSIIRESACGHDCSSCGGCSMAEKREVLVVADDPVGAQKGDVVQVESSTKKLLGIAILVYVLPVVLFFLCYFLGKNYGVGDTMADVIAALGFAVGILAAIIYNRREKKKGTVSFTITSIKR